jgi:hypothetical protein
VIADGEERKDGGKRTEEDYQDDIQLLLYSDVATPEQILGGKSKKKQ